MTAKKVVKKASSPNAKVQVIFARLTDPLKVRSIPKNTRVDEFLQSIGVTFDNIRVNQVVAKPSYILKNGDIISQLQRVSGGC